MNQAFNMDCMTAMKEMPDNAFDLAVVDPPYGIGIDGQKERYDYSKPKHSRKYHERKNWDAQIPPKEYFEELERIRQRSMPDA